MITLKGAYGRKYISKNAALADWEAGRDFQIIGGPYCSIRDLELMTGQFDGVQIRYGEFGFFNYTVIWQSQMSKLLSTTYV